MVKGLSTGREKLGSMANTSRMTSYQRREQLIEIGRSLFAAKGFEAVSVEEIASTAKVSKPIVYEHFGGKEGLYAVVVDREMRALTDVLINALSDPQAHPRQIVERTELALLTYVEENAEGFRVLTRDSPKTDPSNSFNSLPARPAFPPRGRPFRFRSAVPAWLPCGSAHTMPGSRCARRAAPC